MNAGTRTSPGAPDDAEMLMLLRPTDAGGDGAKIAVM
eukprot:SAG31_NODE_43542_length_266_cov_1.245509_1_plen_36_part_10